jgi:glycosyltransferase involved in cell wall biosynthesis
MLRALRLLHRTRPGVRLVVVGTGPLEQHLRQEARELGLAESVLFLGMRDDVPDLLPGFDVFGLTSRFEGLPIALLEALAAGLPAVATTVGGVPEVITDGREGLLVPPGSPEAFALAVQQILDDDVLSAGMSKAAQDRSAAFDVRHAVRRIEQIYEAS